jgi:dTDP-4-amino-4,6-dideoxygalactose transaminase
MRVPLVDLRAQYLEIKDEINAAVNAVIQEAQFVGGRHVQQFEEAFARYCGTRYAVGVSNGSDALRLALLACGIGAGDEVITVPNTFIATTEAISAVGAAIRFVDVLPGSFTMDPEQLECSITERTKAVMPVHLYGRPAEMLPILSIARRRGLRVIADAAQAHGAMCDARGVGTLGDAVCYSFYPAKNLGAYGDGGAVVTNDADIATRITMLRDHGRGTKYEHELEGFSCRLDGLQAAILMAKLPHLEQWTELRRMYAREYSRRLASLSTLRTPPPEDVGTRAVYHLYVVQVPNRGTVQSLLASRGVATGVHYPIPLHLQRAYARLKLDRGSFPAAEEQARTVLSLPMYPELSDEQLRYVAANLIEAVETAVTDPGLATA